MLTDLGERIELNTDHVNKDLENIKMTESKINDAMSEIFKTLEGMNSRLSNTEECVSDLEVRIMEFTQTEQQTHEKILSLIIREMQIKTTVRYHLTLIRMTIIKKTMKNKC